MSTQSRRSGRGTHGSLSKAGRVRSTTPKIHKTSKQKSPSPRISNGRAYRKSLRPKRGRPRRRR